VLDNLFGLSFMRNPNCDPILAIIEAGDGISAAAIGERLGLSKGSVLNAVRWLRMEGSVARVGRGHLQCWVMASRAEATERDIYETMIQREMRERKCSRENVLSRHAKRAARVKRDTEIAANGRRFEREDGPLRIIVAATEAPAQRPVGPASVFELAMFI
jgi:hypothetical protein